MPEVSIVTEGVTDTAVARRLCQECGLEITAVHGEKGKDRLNKSLNGYNNAARYGRWFVLRDLDSDAECAPSLVSKLLPEPSPCMAFRIAVREIESWLIADKQAFARFFSISINRIPSDPESIPNPKEYLINLIRHSRSGAMRTDIVPHPNSGVKVGPGYISRIIEFTDKFWCPVEAGKNSDSLRRCIDRLSHLRAHQSN